MRKATAAAAKPKPRARGKAKPSPDSLSAASSPSDASDGSPSPVAAGRGLLSASKPKPRARARAMPKGKPSPDSLSGASSPSASSGSPSPVAVGRGFLSPASLVTPKTTSKSTPVSVGDLRSLAASGLDSLKRRLDALHAENARDLEASHSRISKRIKMQTQSCVQMAEEAKKAYEMKASYKKLMTDVQSSSSRVCKVTLPEMQKSVARAIDGLRSRYDVPATPA